MPDDNPAIQQEDRFESMEAPEPKANQDAAKADGLVMSSTEEEIQSTLLSGILGQFRMRHFYAYFKEPTRAVEQRDS